MFIKIAENVYVNPDAVEYVEMDRLGTSEAERARVMLRFRGDGHGKLLPIGVDIRDVVARLNGLCTYEKAWTDEVGEIDVCTQHGQNSKYEDRNGPHRPCLAVDPYEETKL